MAQKVVTSLVDDLDESPANETVEFSIGRQSYEIDLNTTHATELRDALAKYVAAARRVSGRRATGRRQDTGVGYTATPTQSGRRPVPSNLSGKREQNQAVREWARKHGAVVGEKGRIPEPITVAYHAGDPAAIPSRYLAGQPEQGTLEPEQPTLVISAGDDVTTGDDAPPSDGPTSTETPERGPGDLPDTPRELTINEKRVIAAWAAGQGMIEKAVPSKVSKDVLSQYKVVMAREAQSA